MQKKVLGVIVKIFLIVWGLFFIIGIIQNISHYNIFEGMIILFITSIPYVIYFFIKFNKRKKSNIQLSEEQAKQTTQKANEMLSQAEEEYKKAELLKKEYEEKLKNVQEVCDLKIKKADEHTASIIENEKKILEKTQEECNKKIQQTNELIDKKSKYNNCIKSKNENDDHFISENKNDYNQNIPQSTNKIILPEYQVKGITKQAILDHLRIMSDCLNILQTTLNPETFFTRFDLLIEHAKKLTTFESYVNSEQFKPDEILNQVKANKQDMIIDFINRYLNSILNKIKTIKTPKSKLNQIQKFYDTLEQYKDNMDNPTIEYYTNQYHKHSNVFITPEVQTEIKIRDKGLMNLYIQELDKQAKDESDKAYKDHTNTFKNLDFRNVNVKSGDIKSLTSTEKYFLKALSNQIVDELHFPVYWTYEYHINYKQLITKLIENGYVKIACPSDDLSFLTTVQLKEILKFFSLKTSGKKQDLIERIQDHENIDDALKSLNLYKERFILTPIGKKAIEFLPQSITKDLEFEDRCLSLIMEQNFNEAYK